MLRLGFASVPSGLAVPVLRSRHPGYTAGMTPEEFIALWKNNPLTERAGEQAWFDDLCELLGVAKPRDPDNYCFERGAGKSGGGDGWADVWMRGRFGWENNPGTPRFNSGSFKRQAVQAA